MGGTAMIFAPARLGSVTLDNETLAADKKGCRRFGPCGVGEKALYLNSFFIDRHYYVALSSVRRVFKRVAMSKGGFTGKGAFGSIPYLVVEHDGGEKQCNFKHEEDVDNLLAYLSKLCPDLPLQSRKVEQHMAQQRAENARRYLKELTPQAQAERERLEQARTFLEDHTNLTRRLSQARIDDFVASHAGWIARHLEQQRRRAALAPSAPSYKWVALAIVIAGLIALVYGVVSMIRGTNSVGIYFALFGLAAVFLFSGAHVLPTARNNKTALTREWEQAQADLAAVLPKDFPLPARYAHPVVLTRMIRVLREGRAQTVDEALDVVKRDLKALTADVQVEQWEYDEVVAVKPMFLLSDYQ
jgi:hypothetical protein